MEPGLVISIAVVVLAVASLGCIFGLYISRARSNTEKDTVARLAAELADLQKAHVETVVERVVGLAGESFDSRLQTGTAEFEHRRQAIDLHLDNTQKQIDERLGAVVSSLTEKVESVDKLVSERVGGMSKNLSQQVTTMNTELGQLRLLVAQLQKERAQQHGKFVESLETATRQQMLLAETTGQLRDALASPQSRGQWGERMAEDVLRSAGMREGFNYHKQHQIAGGTRPDFTFLLPDDRLLHMDVKFPFQNYLRYLEASSEVEAVPYRDQFLKDVRQRVDELNDRDYAASDTTLGYLLLFIPNESVYGFMHENDATLLDHALGQNVVLCSPTTLFAMLGIIRHAMDSFALERASNEILACLGGFDEQWKKFSGQIDKVQRHFETLANSLGDLAGTRRRVLERQLGRIDDLRQHALADSDEPVRGELSGPDPPEETDSDTD